MKRYFKDACGGTASIKETPKGLYRLRVADGTGRTTKRGVYDTHRGARIAMGRMSDCWRVQ